VDLIVENLCFEKIYKIVSEFQLNFKEEDIFNFLKIRNRWPYQYYHDIDFSNLTSKNFEYFCPVQCIGYNNNPIYDEFYDKRGRFIFDIWKKYHDLGFTTMISDVLDLNESLRFLQQKIFEVTGTSVIGNFYLTGTVNDTIPSWKHHKHSYDVVVKSIYGKSLWKIDDSMVELEDNTIGILSNTYHSVISCPTKRLSLTINI
jgi:hypothetical protein